MSSELVGYLIAAALGILTSVLGWLVTMRAVRPEIGISEEISRIAPPSGDDERAYLYRIKVRNARRARAALDIQIQCRISMKDVFDDRKKARSYYRIPTAMHQLVELKPRVGRVVWLHLHRAEGLQHRLLTTNPKLAAKMADGSIRLEELLQLPEALLIFSVRTNDALSNSPRVNTQKYKTGCVRIGYFETKSLRINPLRSEGYELSELNSSERSDEAKAT